MAPTARMPVAGIRFIIVSNAGLAAPSSSTVATVGSFATESEAQRWRAALARASRSTSFRWRGDARLHAIASKRMSVPGEAV
jgi:hypothetical protein